MTPFSPHSLSLRSAAHGLLALRCLLKLYLSLLLAHQRLVRLVRRVDRSYSKVEAGGRTNNRGNGGDDDCNVGNVGEGLPSLTQSNTMYTTNGANTTTFLPLLVSQPPFQPALTQHGNYTNVVYVKHLAQSEMELYHQCNQESSMHGKDEEDG